MPASDGFLFSLLFKLENASNMFLRNVGFSSSYTALQPRRATFNSRRRNLKYNTSRQTRLKFDISDFH